MFLSVPKTGTTAYEAALAPHAAMAILDPPELKHAPVFRYNRYFRPAIEKFMGDGFDVLAVMREPIDWLGSWYRYRRRPFMKGQPNATFDISFDAFVDAYCQGQRPGFANVGAQSKFLEPQKNGTCVTHLFAYEDQAGLRNFLQSRLDLAFELERLNESPDQEITLSPKIEVKLRRKFEGEFTLYESISPGGKYQAMSVS